MAGYRQSNPDRAKAALAALLVHVAIGAAFLTGLVVNVSKQPADIMETIDIALPPPPPPIVEKEESAPKGDPGEAGKKAEPTPIVAPKPKIELPAKPPVAAAPVPGQGAAPSAGAANSGTGTGAGGSGTGLGGGGSGGAGYSPARMIRKIPDREYRRISATGIRNGSVTLRLLVSKEGRVSNCGIERSSGDASVDAFLCQLTQHYVRFRPARNPQGQAVTYGTSWTPVWYSTRGQ